MGALENNSSPWQLIATYNDLAEAEVARSMLAAYGISVRLLDAHVSAVYGGGGLVVGGIQLWVSRIHTPVAQDLLKPSV